jgi:hypothetical protein
MSYFEPYHRSGEGSMPSAHKRFKNTSKAPSPFLKEVVRFCTPTGTGKVRIWFKRHKGRSFYGRCWHSRHYVSAHIADPYMLQVPYHGAGSAGNGYLPWNACTWEEAVVALVAHEIRHIWQSHNPRGHKVWGARGRQSERECDAYAIRKMREWRWERAARTVVRRKGWALARWRTLGA